MKNFQEYINDLSAGDRKAMCEGAARIVNDPVFRAIMDGLQAMALHQLATVEASNTNLVRKHQERYQALKQIDIELANLELALPKRKLAVV